MIQSITAVCIPGDGWTTDDDMQFYREGVRPATAQEIYENMTTEEMIAELRVRAADGNTVFEAIALEMERLVKLRKIVTDFVDKNQIHCPTKIGMTDRVIENAADFIDSLCSEVGFLPREEE